MLGYSLIIGMNAALNVLIGKTSGAGNMDLCITYLKRARMIITVYFIIIMLMMTQTDKILVAIGQDPEVAKHAHRYNMAFMPTLYIMGLIDA